MKALGVVLATILAVGVVTASAACQEGSFTQGDNAASLTQTFGDSGAPCGLCPDDNKPLPNVKVESCRGAFDPKTPMAKCFGIPIEQATCMVVDRSKAGGANCGFDGECASDSCNTDTHKCLKLETPTVKEGEPCGKKTTADTVTHPICEVEFRCSGTNDDDKKCVKLVADTEQCASDIECKSGLCVDQKCKPAFTVAENEDCRGRLDCQPGLVCTSPISSLPAGKCVKLYSQGAGFKTHDPAACSVAAPWKGDQCTEPATSETSCSCTCTFSTLGGVAVPTCTSDTNTCSPGQCDCGKKKCSSTFTPEEINTLNECKSKADKAAQDALKNKGYPTFIRDTEMDAATGQYIQKQKQAAFDLHCCQGDLSVRTGTPADQFSSCSNSPAPSPKPQEVCSTGTYTQEKSDKSIISFTYPGLDKPCGLCQTKDGSKATAVNVARCAGEFDPKSADADCRSSKDSYVCTLSKKTAGMACENNDDCESGSCNTQTKKCRGWSVKRSSKGGSCNQAPTIDDSTITYTFCADGLYCGGDNTCQELKADDKECGSGNECKSALCVRSKCAPAFSVEKGKECYVDLSCKRGFGCTKNNGQEAGVCAEYYAGDDGFETTNPLLCSNAAPLNVGENKCRTPKTTPDSCQCTCSFDPTAKKNPTCSVSANCGVQGCDCAKQTCYPALTAEQIKLINDCDRKRKISEDEETIRTTISVVIGENDGAKERAREAACCKGDLATRQFGATPCSFPSSKSSSGLGSGAIAGIIIGVLIGILLIVAIGVVIFIKFGRGSGDDGVAYKSSR